jgi:acyl-ACP thioesterase
MAEKLKSEWKTEQTICSYDVDPHQMVRLPALCRFMQEAAYHHAGHLGLGHDYLSSRNMGWVLARQRIEIDQLPQWGDTVSIRTWPSGRDRLFFYRDFEITDRDGCRVLIASNAWSLIDIQKRERVSPDTYLGLDIPEGGKVFEAKLARIKGCARSAGQTLPVTYGDLDLNGHVNNVRYLEWVLDTLCADFHEKHALKKMEANYLAEAVSGQEVTVCSGEQRPLHYVHTISAGEVELFRAETLWEG